MQNLVIFYIKMVKLPHNIKKNQHSPLLLWFLLLASCVFAIIVIFNHIRNWWVFLSISIRGAVRDQPTRSQWAFHLVSKHYLKALHSHQPQHKSLPKFLVEVSWWYCNAGACGVMVVVVWRWWWWWDGCCCRRGGDMLVVVCWWWLFWLMWFNGDCGRDFGGGGGDFGVLWR